MFSSLPLSGSGGSVIRTSKIEVQKIAWQPNSGKRAGIE